MTWSSVVSLVSVDGAAGDAGAAGDGGVDVLVPKGFFENPRHVWKRPRVCPGVTWVAREQVGCGFDFG